LIQDKMIVGIDAANLRDGGTATHLVELLRAARPHENGFERVIVWGGKIILNMIEDRPWLQKVHEPMLDKALPFRLFWEGFHLDRRVRQEACNILLIPGGTYFGAFRPFVTMCQNMLPFEWSEIRRFGISWLTMKFLAMRILQLATFKRANGIIFPTEYARKTLCAFLFGHTIKTIVIPHGVDERFRKAPRPQKPITMYSEELPFSLLYVSSVYPYKHQWNVMEAVYRLRQSGLPLQLVLVGKIYSSGRRFYNSVSQYDSKKEWIHYLGDISFNSIHESYQKADLFVFASSCESISIVLLEAMAGGLPIGSSNRGPMPEILNNAAVYFNPEKTNEIADALRTLIEDHQLREKNSWTGYDIVKTYTWKRCADETFNMLAQVKQSTPD
jgi:glycosyltransferase involved in cell wall biosynthesis